MFSQLISKIITLNKSYLSGPIPCNLNSATISRPENIGLISPSNPYGCKLKLVLSIHSTKRSNFI